MRGGDVRLFNDTMDAQQFRFIQEVTGWHCAADVAGGRESHHLSGADLRPVASQPSPRPAARPNPPAQGTYLLLEKLRYAVYRRLLRKVHGVHGELEPDKRTQIPLAQLQHALVMQARVQGCLRLPPLLPVGLPLADDQRPAACLPAWPAARLLAMRLVCCPPQGVALDMDEVECVVANLIFRRYVKGYVAHKSKVLVVAKADPFQDLAGASLTD